MALVTWFVLSLSLSLSLLHSSVHLQQWEYFPSALLTSHYYSPLYLPLPVNLSLRLCARTEKCSTPQPPNGLTTLLYVNGVLGIERWVLCHHSKQTALWCKSSVAMAPSFYNAHTNQWSVDTAPLGPPGEHYWHTMSLLDSWARLLEGHHCKIKHHFICSGKGLAEF